MRAAEPHLPTPLIDQLAKKIESEMGLGFAAQKRGDLVSAIREIADIKGLDEGDCVSWLLEGSWDTAKSDLCADRLTVPETYFFREPGAFDLVCDYARDQLASAGGRDRPIRLWSAGCCTGEEAYSLALALRYRVPELDPERVSILATDLCKSSLQSARSGVYRQWSFRNELVPQRSVNFHQAGANQYRIHDRIKRRVTFAELNLAAPVYPSPTTDTCEMDIIFCRNVLMYFSKSQARAVINRFRESLINGGWLVVSASEASVDLFPGYRAIRRAGVLYFQKSDPFILRPMEKPIVATPPQEANLVERVVPDAVCTAPVAVPSPVQIRRHIDGLEPTVVSYYVTALDAMEAGDQREALRNLKRVIYLQPNFVLAHYLMGVLQAEHNPGEASRPFRTASELLAAMDDTDLIPGSEGMSAAYLRGSVHAYLGEGD